MLAVCASFALVMHCLFPLAAKADNVAGLPQEQEGYGDSTILDGWRALGYAVVQPFSRSFERGGDCVNWLEPREPITPLVVVPVCGVYGFVEGAVVGVCAATLGVVDIVTFGIFELSYRAGFLED
jgi:hypothetical protein